MSAATCHAALSALLARHVALIDAANAYLQGVRQAIAENDPESLQRTLEQPEFDVDAIEQLERERHGLLEAHGFGTDAGGFETCIDWCDDASGSVTGLYRQLVQGLVALQHSIQLNQLLVDRGKDRVRRSLCLLGGLGGAGHCKTYGSDGKARQADGRRNIATA